MKPLSGIRILEFDGLGPVTFAGMLLADMGAEVIRLTRSASVGAAVFGEVGGEILHRGRSAVEVDLKSPDDHALVLDLVDGADALIEGFRPGVMERLGLGPDVLLKRNPRLVFGRITGWGQTGPMATRAGHDLNYIALSGALHGMGEPDRPPRPPLNLVGDYGGGAMFLVAGLLAALVASGTTGRGQVVDAAMTDGSSLLTALFYALSAKGLWSDARGANLLDGGAPFYRCFTCRDGKYVAVGALEPQFYAALIAGLSLEPKDAVQFDLAGWPALHRRFEALFAQRDRDDWVARFEGSDACVSPVLDLKEAASHPHNVARGAFVTQGVVQPALAPRFGDTPTTPTPQPASMSAEAAVAAWRIDRPLAGRPSRSS